MVAPGLDVVGQLVVGKDPARDSRGLQRQPGLAACAGPGGPAQRAGRQALSTADGGNLTTFFEEPLHAGRYPMLKMPHIYPRSRAASRHGRCPSAPGRSGYRACCQNSTRDRRRRVEGARPHLIAAAPTADAGSVAALTGRSSCRPAPRRACRGTLNRHDAAGVCPTPKGRRPLPAASDRDASVWSVRRGRRVRSGSWRERAD